LGKRPADDDRRARILQAAEHSFVRYGFHAATMLQVADEAGMSAGNLYRYFPSKDAIVEGLCARDQEERAASFAALAQSSRVFEAVAGGLRHHLLTRPPEKARMILEVWAEGARNPRIAVMGRQIDDSVRAGLIEIFDRAKMNGEAAASLDSGFAARVLFTLVGGLFKRLAHEGDFDVATETAMALGVLRALFDGALRPWAPEDLQGHQ
jgi:AcrR family transcriptional regulator